jgi:hypothetical protein
MFQHFGQRLKRDLKQLVDRRLDASVLASGSVQKVTLTILFQICIDVSPVLRCRGRCHLTQTSTVGGAGLCAIIS